MVLVCLLCPVERSLHFSTITDYLKYIQLFHVHQPNFRITCGISGCQQTFEKFHTFRNHVSDLHSCDPNPSNQPVDSLPEPDDGISIQDSSRSDPDADCVQDDADLNTTLSTIQSSSALFLMCLKEERKLTHTALQGVVEGVMNLSQSHLTVLHSEVCSIL